MYLKNRNCSYNSVLKYLWLLSHKFGIFLIYSSTHIWYIPDVSQWHTSGIYPCMVFKTALVRSGIRTHAYICRLRPDRSALDHSVILTVHSRICSKGSWASIFYTPFSMQKTRLIVVGFEPTPPKWLVPKTSALDHSATLPCVKLPKSSKTAFLLSFCVFVFLNTIWQRWDSNPRHRSDWCLKPAP